MENRNNLHILNALPLNNGMNHSFPKVIRPQVTWQPLIRLMET